eukprot:8654487-Alexandrium_andersonii.AAC.1
MGNADAGSARRSASRRRHSRTMPRARIDASKASAQDMVSAANVLRQTRPHVWDLQSSRLAGHRLPSRAGCS